VSPGSIGREFAGVRLLHDVAVEDRAQPEVGRVELGGGHELGAEREEPVLALDAQHRAAVGVAEVVQADVVGARVAGDVGQRVGLGRAVHAAADHDGQLALVVEELRAGRAANHSAMAVERGRRLHEERGLRRDPRGVLLDAAAVREVDGDDLRRLGGSEVRGRRLLDPRPVVEHDRVAFAAPPGRLAGMEDTEPPVGLGRLHGG
jgi:hypothetical protein